MESYDVYSYYRDEREGYKMSLILMSQSSRMGKNNQTIKKEEYQDLGTCKNCQYQGNCPFGSQCSRSCFLDKKKKSVDRFKLK